ncbi:MAG: hypothetical protein MJK12_04325 [Colwellia sp.]|nr:hypothetical protein [Colwellia sp.]
MTITLTKQHLIALLFTLLFFSFSLSWYIFPSLYWLLGPAMALTVISAIVLWFRNREDDAVKQRKTLEKQDKLTVKRLFNLLLRELKDRGQYKQKYRLPWYLYISHNIQSDSTVLTQMGFRHSSLINIDSNFVIQVWLKNNAVMLTVNLSEDDYRSLNCIKLLISRVKAFRSRQALNGILLSQSIEHLLSKDKTHNKQMAHDSRVVVDEAQRLCGQKLPLYVLFNQMANLADFCPFFSSLEDHQLEGCFGAINSSSQSIGTFTLPWFNNAFDGLCSQMGRAVVFALERQLNEAFRRSVIAAPAQFRQIKGDISFYLTELLQAKTSSQEYQFRGFFFTNTESNSAAIDPLTKRVAYQLEHHEMIVPDGEKFSHSIFITEFFNRFVRPEAGMAQVNKVRQRILFAFKVSYWLFILGIVGTTAGLLKVNFDYYQSLNLETLMKLEGYKKSIQQAPYHINKLAENIKELDKLSNIYRDYKRPVPAYIFELVPNPSLLPALEKTYHTELLNILLPSLVRDIETKLFSYQQSGNILQTAKLLSLTKSLQTHSHTDWLALKNYYQQVNEENALIPNGLLRLMDDLYFFGIPEITVNKKLITQAELKIHTKNSAQVIYDYIKALPQFSSVVDVHEELGNNFEQLFQIQDSAILQVPFIYTPQGFAALNLNANATLIKETVDSNKALLGDQINEFQINNLVQQLQRLYQREYINYWRGFINNISLKPIENHSVSYSLSLLVAETDAPLKQLYDVIGYYTSPKLQALVSNKITESNTDKTTSLLKKISPPATPSEDQRLMEKTIKDEFSRYHYFIKTDENGVSKLSNFVSHFAKVKIWLDKARKSNDINAEYFQQLTSTEIDQSLYQLSQLKPDIKKLDDYKKAFVSLTNANIQKLVTTYIDKQWKQQVNSPFYTLFAKTFPFSLKSQSSANLKQFNRYFKLGGLFDQHTERLLVKFNRADGQIFLNGFMPNDAIYVSTVALEQLTKLEEIQQVLYQQGKKQFSIPFKLNVKSMSASLLKFELFSQRSLMSYQHGPKLWRDFVWPDLTTKSELLAIFTNTAGQKTTINYSGDWAWLRLIYQNYQMNLTQTEIKLNHKSDEIRLIIAVESDENPLEPTFFSQFRPPEQLIRAQ